MSRSRPGIDILNDMGQGYVCFRCPGCKSLHQLRVNREESEANFKDHPFWTWNGSMDKPTFSPSILQRTGCHAPHYKPGSNCWCTYDKEHPNEPSGFKCGVCHSFVNNGMIQFLNDCTHELAGQTVPIPPWIKGEGS